MAPKGKYLLDRTTGKIVYRDSLTVEQFYARLADGESRYVETDKTPEREA